MTGLQGKTALIPGSTSGTGQATAVALAARGAHLLIVGRNEQRAEDVVAEIGGEGSATEADFDELHGDGSPTSGALMRFPDAGMVLRWYSSPGCPKLIDGRGVAMDARFSLPDSLPTPTEEKSAE